jgi:predicted transposase YbfD/YdcC
MFKKVYQMSPFVEDSVMSYFTSLDDPRNGQNISHPLINIITIAILGVICGADGWVDIERYGHAKRAWLSTFLDLSKGIPSHDTFGRVFSWLAPEQFQASFRNWTQHLWEKSSGQLVNLDGKKLRRSRDKQHGKDGIWMVSAWVEANRLVLGQEKVAEKGSEISTLPRLLAQLDITGCVVTLDAIGTQTEIARMIIAGQADYILAVKKNQGTLYDDLAMLFDGLEQDAYHNLEVDSYKQITEKHGRTEIRHCWVLNHPDYLFCLRGAQDWDALHSLVKLLTVRQQGDKTEIATRYFISSWNAPAQAFLRAIRGHWHIENSLHWILDIAFREDESRIRNHHAPQNMAILRHLALNLLKQELSVNVGIAAKRKMAGWNNDYLLKVLAS